MQGADRSPSLLRWELRTVLRGHRDRLGLLGEDVSRAVQEYFAGSFSQAKLSRIEGGQQLPSPRDVSDLARVYKLDAEERERLIQLAKNAKQPGWWQKYDTVEVKYQTYTDYESAAVHMRNYESTFVPGLLQTEAYAKAVIDGLNPDYTAEHLDDLLQVRMRRQGRLREPDALRLHVIIQENSLRRTIGSPQVMLDQIDHLRAMSELPNVTIQVIPFDAGLYEGLTASAFVLLDFYDPDTLPTVCYIEGILYNLFSETRAQTDRIIAAFDEMRDDVALSVEMTRDFLSELRDRVASRTTVS